MGNLKKKTQIIQFSTTQKYPTRKRQASNYKYGCFKKTSPKRISTWLPNIKSASILVNREKKLKTTV